MCDTRDGSDSDELPANTRLWRYLTYERFADLLATRSLWFTRPCNFDDKWEGMYPESYYLNAHKWMSNADDWTKEDEADFVKRWQHNRYATFVNCWHISDHESDAMWRLYGRGVAIQSTVGMLKTHLNPPVYGSGCVLYYDPEKNGTDPKRFSPDILRKRISFWCDREFRLWLRDSVLIQRIENGEEVNEAGLSNGIPVQVSEIPDVFERVVIAPGKDDAFMQQVKDACQTSDLPSLAKRVEPSYLDRLHPSFIRFTKSKKA